LILYLRLGAFADQNQAIFEFIATESTYNRDLQLIVQSFYAPLLDILDEKALTVIFANVEDILLANTGFYSSLEERQKSCRLYVDVVGDVLEEGMRAMGVYEVSLGIFVEVVQLYRNSMSWPRVLCYLVLGHKLVYCRHVVLMKWNRHTV